MNFLFRALVPALSAVLATAAFAQSSASARWADPAKTLRTSIIIAETGFDPQASQDLYSNTINSAIFEALYEYDYLARPHRIVPRTAEGMPEVSSDGLTWKIKVKKGIFFADDPVFKGAKRELTAHDYV
jgi:ABC-type transport system substrate-binding protein